MRIRCGIGLLVLGLLSGTGIGICTGQIPAIEVSGTTVDGTGRPVDGAEIALGPATTIGDSAGSWRLSVPAGRHTLVVRKKGFQTLQRILDITADTGSVEIALTAVWHLHEHISVQAVRAEERDPVTRSEIERPQIEQENRGQELPFLLAATPSVTSQSDSGLAAGYAYFTLRGIAQTRLNVTLDGIPLQDPEDQALYFSNFGDFAGVVESIQIQRGVGTSTVGSSSYGGSVNIASVNPAEAPSAELQLGGGSWGTGRAAAAFHSGRLSGGLALFGRMSAQTTDGFRRHSGADQSTIYYGATRQDSNSFLKLFGFSGRTKTRLAFLATEESILEQDLRANALGSDERDDFGQDVFHAQYTRALGSATTLLAQGYYNGAQGWFRIRDSVSGELEQYGLNGQSMGMVLGATHQGRRLDLHWGTHLSRFTRDHFMDVVQGARAYRNTGKKQEANTFVKATWKTGRLQWWGDAQVRHARFAYRGDIPLGSVDWTFFNPRAGFRFDPLSAVGLYVSVGRMSREPARSDLLAGEDNASLFYDLRGVRPERVTDVEAGVEWHRTGIRVRSNLYAMEFRNEIALTGELSEIGLPMRRNIDRSFRRGVEVDAAWIPSSSWRLTGQANFSRNRIRSWKQYYDDYDAEGTWLGSKAVEYRDIAPLLTPQAILNGTVDWFPVRSFSVGTSARWVSGAQLDNTGHPDFRTPDYFLLDAQASIGLSRWLHFASPRLLIQTTNLLNNRRAWPGGYSYRYYSADEQGNSTPQGSSYFYPLATRSLFITLEMRF